jgi:hypothetical protein
MHASSGTSDVTFEFDDALTTGLGRVAMSAQRRPTDEQLVVE